MKPLFRIALPALIIGMQAATPKENFRHASKGILRDTLKGYNYQKREALFEKSGRIPLKTFSEEDQAYILHWNQLTGFTSTFRFKLEMKKKRWARMKHEQNRTPFYMDVFLIPKKSTPHHEVVEAEDYEEASACYLEAEGFELTLRNQNLFPLEQIVVESSIFYEQRSYLMGDSLFLGEENDFDETTVTNRIRRRSETIPLILPREEVVVYSAAAILADQQLERNVIVSGSGSGEESEEWNESEETVEGFGDWSDHNRRRRDKLIGVWFRVGVQNMDGEMVWREVSHPASLPDQVSWEDNDA